MPVPPESSTVNDVPDGNCSNWSTTVTSSSKNLPTMGTDMNAPTAITVLVHQPMDLAQTPPEDAALIGQAMEIVESTNHASDEVEVNQVQDAMALQDTFIPSTVPEDEAKVDQIQARDAKAFQDTFIPFTVPEEIQAIIDSYLSGRPLLLVISNKRFFAHWSLQLPKEFGFSMLGYFRILGVQVLTPLNPQFLC